jgi:hypothetical protein
MVPEPLDSPVAETLAEPLRPKRADVNRASPHPRLI